MRALVKTKPEPGFLLQQVPDPQPGDGEVLIRVQATSLCGTDAHIYRWDEWAQQRIHPPRIIGHELCGEVVVQGLDRLPVRIVPELAASAKDFEERRDPLLITPGFKVGKDGLEKSFDKELTGKPGAKRVEVTARGKIVRELTTRPDSPGQSIKLTIDAGLQEYAGRRLATQSGSVVVIDCSNGDVLAMASMPSFEPRPATGLAKSR